MYQGDGQYSVFPHLTSYSVEINREINHLREIFTFILAFLELFSFIYISVIFQLNQHGVNQRRSIQLLYISTFL